MDAADVGVFLKMVRVVRHWNRFASLGLATSSARLTVDLGLRLDDAGTPRSVDFARRGGSSAEALFRVPVSLVC